MLAEGQPISFAMFRWLVFKTRVFVGIFILRPRRQARYFLF